MLVSAIEDPSGRMIDCVKGAEDCEKLYIMLIARAAQQHIRRYADLNNLRPVFNRLIIAQSQ